MLHRRQLPVALISVKRFI